MVLGFAYTLVLLLAPIQIKCLSKSAAITIDRAALGISHPLCAEQAFQPWRGVILDGAIFLRVLAPAGKVIATIAEAVLP